MNVLRISQLWIYPVKSLGGISVHEAKLGRKGFEYDRRWMLVSPDGMFMTQRKTPKLALFRCSFAGSELCIGYDGEMQYIPLHQDTGETVTVKIWKDVVSALRVSELLDEWFSRKLGYRCSLVYFPEPNARLIDPDYSDGAEHVSLADGFPYLIIGEESLNELNQRLDTPVPMNRFRPNIVFSGGVPFEEDTWQHFQVGDKEFRGVKPCGRCVLTTVDQETGIAGQEPLRTLASFRSKGNKILFGQNAIANDLGLIKLNDVVSVSTYVGKNT